MQEKTFFNIQDGFEYILTEHGKRTINSSIRIYVNKIENRIIFQIKMGNYKTMKLLGSTKGKITIGGNGEYVPYLEITEVL